MKIRAEVIPFSSIVGGGVTLHDDTGRVIGQLMLMNVHVPSAVVTMDEAAMSQAAFKQAYVALAERVAAAINAGQAESQVTHTKRGTTYDVVASAALFQLSGALSRAVADGDPVTVYRNPEGMHFVRFPDEMVSPRFEKVQP